MEFLFNEKIRSAFSAFWNGCFTVRRPNADGDPYARANALAILPLPEGLLGDLRQCVLFNLRSTGPIRVRSVLVGLGQMPPKEDETPFGREQLGQMIVSAIEQEPDFRDRPAGALADIRALTAALNERLGSATAPDLGPLADVVKFVLGLMPAAATEEADEAGDAPAEGSSARPRGALGSVSSRDDALRAIDMVCEYLDRTEPTNPAQLLLRRARHLISHNFLQLIKALAPEALEEAARIMGVDPASVNLDSDP